MKVPFNIQEYEHPLYVIRCENPQEIKELKSYLKREQIVYTIPRGLQTLDFAFNTNLSVEKLSDEQEFQYIILYWKQLCPEDTISILSLYEGDE